MSTEKLPPIKPGHTTKCVVCGVENTGDLRARWRKDKCNACYAKALRTKRKLREESDDPGPKPRGKWGGEKVSPLGVKLPVSSAHLLLGLSKILDCSRTDIIVRMCNELVKLEELDRIEVMEIGRNEMEDLQAD